MNPPTPQFPPPMNDKNQHPVDERPKSINAKWKIIAYTYTFISLGLAIYWEIPEPTGLNEMVYDFQVGILEDSYYPALDIMVSLLVLLIPLFIAKFIVTKVTGVKIDNPNFRK